jgi:hypothetical protein
LRKVREHPNGERLLSRAGRCRWLIPHPESNKARPTTRRTRGAGGRSIHYVSGKSQASAEIFCGTKPLARRIAVAGTPDDVPS